MKTFLKLIATFIIGFIIICGLSLLTDKSRFGQWVIHDSLGKKTEITWIRFYWVSDNFGNKHYEKTAMFIPAKIEGLPLTFSFQFDLGSDLTMIYENKVSSIFKRHPEFSNRITKFKSPLQFWNSQKAFKNSTLDFGDIKATSENCFVKRNYGQELSLNNLTDSTPIQIGTIGADLFQGKVLIIDYPNGRFTICDTLPSSFYVSFTKIDLDKGGRVILPLTLKGKGYKVLFDNGSSLFPLLVTDDKINNFSTSSGTDTIAISSWGITHNVIARPLKDSFELGGQSFANISVYADYRKEARTNNFDALAGNALFWGKTVIIDFKNKRFGVK